MIREDAILHMVLRREALKQSVGDLDEDIKAFDMAIEALEQKQDWIPVGERLPMLNEEAYSDDVLVQLKDTKFSISEGACSVHITKIAVYDENAISSDGSYMDTEGWILDNGKILSMDEVIAWMPLPKSLKAGSMSYTDKEKAKLQDTVLNKIRAEIEQLPTNTRTNWNGCCPDIDYPEIEYVDISKKQLLDIIDKYIQEVKK